MPNAPRFNWFWVFFLASIFLIVSTFLRAQQSIESIPYSQFLSYLEQGQIAEVTVSTDRVTGRLRQPLKGNVDRFTTVRVEDPKLADRLEAAKVKFTALPENKFWGTLLGWLIPILFLYFILTYFARRASNMPRGGGGLLPFGKSKAKIYVETGLKTRFDDVAGIDEAKAELREIVEFLRNPKHYSKLGGHMPKGALLVGPPGTGKTLLARAVAGEANVPFFSINGSEFVELFVGLGAARVRDLFEQARGKAPCIVFIDELDALGKARGISAISGSANDEKEQTLNQLLAEMDGFGPSSGIIVLAATNRPEVLDPALMRAGRFDRQILVDKPDKSGREKILAIHTKNITLSPDTKISEVAGITAGFSGADLANLTNEAALTATRRGAESVELRDFTQAMERIVAGIERRSRILGIEEKRRVAFHEMGHATVALALGKSEVVHKVSIIPRGIGALGYTLRRPTEDRYLVSRRELEIQLAVALGGRASELLFLDDISTGAGDDLDKATEIAKAMVTRYGMTEEVGLGVFEHEINPMLGNHGSVRSNYSEKTAELIDHSIKGQLDSSFVVSIETIRKNSKFVHASVELLLKQETIDEDGLKRLWEAHHDYAIAGAKLVSLK